MSVTQDDIKNEIAQIKSDFATTLKNLSDKITALQLLVAQGADLSSIKAGLDDLDADVKAGDPGTAAAAPAAPPVGSGG